MKSEPGGAKPKRGLGLYKKKKAAGAAAHAAAPASPGRQATPPQNRASQRAAGGVPPAEAFNHVRRRPPPNLPGGPPPVQATPPQPQAPGHAAQGRKKGKPQAGRGKRDGKAVGEASAPQREQRKPKQTRPQKPVNPARRRRRRQMAAVLAAAALIMGGVVLSVNLLFKIGSFDLQGESPYSVEEIAGAFGLGPGDNMYGFSAGNAAERIAQRLPYIENVVIRRRLPSTVVFRVQAAEEAYFFPWGDGFAVMSNHRKILKLTGETPSGLTRIDGLDGLVVEPGQVLGLTEEAAEELELVNQRDASASEADVSGTDSSAVDTSQEAFASEGSAQSGEEDGQAAEDGQDASGPEQQPNGEQAASAPPTPAERYSALDVLLQALGAAELGELTWIDVSDPLQLRFRWQDRITVELGPKSNTQEKLATVAVLLQNEEGSLIGENDSGTLDMTYYMATGRCFFTDG